MKKSALETAHYYLKRRCFSKAITTLEGAYEQYRESFDYYMTAGTACLYLKEFGNANAYFQQARKIHLTDTNLALAQAVLYLRRGNTEQAIHYYLEVLETEPENKIAKNALQFIRDSGESETIFNWADSGRLEQFYPPLGVNPVTVRRIVCAVLAVVTLGGLAVFLLRPRQPSLKSERYDLTELALSYEETKHLVETDASGSVYRYVLSDKEIRASYENALQYVLDYRDNAATVELNRILLSNASDAMRQKAIELLSRVEEPTLDTVTDNYPYRQVAADPLLYVGCWVVWEGSVGNAIAIDNTYRCDLLVGYKPSEGVYDVEGKVGVYFPVLPKDRIDGSRSVRILAKVGIEKDTLALLGRTVYQPLQKQAD